jgi:hypothetical protein
MRPRRTSVREYCAGVTPEEAMRKRILTDMLSNKVELCAAHSPTGTIIDRRRMSNEYEIGSV